jgi:hypothetical protein
MPILPREVDLSTAGTKQIVEPSQIVSSLFVSEVTPGARYFIQLGTATPSGPYTGAGLTMRLGSDVPIRERNEGVSIVVREPVPNGLLVIQVAYTS